MTQYITAGGNCTPPSSETIGYLVRSYQDKTCNAI